MVNDTPSRKKARELRKAAKKLRGEARILGRVTESRALGAVKANRAVSMDRTALALTEHARLEDLTVRQSPIEKKNKKGETKTYYRWLCSWRDGNKIITHYLGSTKKMNQEQALEKARKLKAQALGIFI